MFDLLAEAYANIINEISLRSSLMKKEVNTQMICVFTIITVAFVCETCRLIDVR